MKTPIKSKTTEKMTSEPLLDHEKTLVNRLNKTAIKAGVMNNHTEIVNFYVSLKSKPLAILVGPKNSGKSDIVRSFAKSLIQGKLHYQYQPLYGHPWWIERSENQVSLGKFHSLFNTEKFQIVTEIAGHLSNEKHIFLACMSQISPAEVTNFFMEIARQLLYGRVIHLQETTMLIPFIYPHNLLVVGTMDMTNFNWYDENLLTHTMIIHWQDSDKTIGNLPVQELYNFAINGEEEFLCSRIRNVDTAQLKIHHILDNQYQALKPVLKVESILLKHGLTFPTRQVTNETIIYLANAWTNSNTGLFDQSHNRNLEIALDFAIAQNILPWGWELIRQSASLRSDLREVLCGQYPNSQGFLEQSAMVL